MRSTPTALRRPTSSSMAFLRRREPLHERLAREGGLTERPPQGAPRPLWQEPGVTGLHRPREADAIVTADAPDVEGDAVRFVVARGRHAARRGGRGLAARAARGGGRTGAAAAVPRARGPARRDALGDRGEADRGARDSRRSGGRRDRRHAHGRGHDARRRRRSASSARSPSLEQRGAARRHANTPCMRNGSTATSGRFAPRRSEHGDLPPPQDEETLNEQMLREAGIDEEQPAEETGETDPPEPLDPYAGTLPRRPAWAASSRVLDRAMARPAVWDSSRPSTRAGIAGRQGRVRDASGGRCDRRHGDGRRRPLAARGHGREAAEAAVPRRSPAARATTSGRSPRARSTSSSSSSTAATRSSS